MRSSLEWRQWRHFLYRHAICTRWTGCVRSRKQMAGVMSAADSRATEDNKKNQLFLIFSISAKVTLFGNPALNKLRRNNTALAITDHKMLNPSNSSLVRHPRKGNPSRRTAGHDPWSDGIALKMHHGDIFFFFFFFLPWWSLTAGSSVCSCRSKCWLVYLEASGCSRTMDRILFSLLTSNSDLWAASIAGWPFFSCRQIIKPCCFWPPRWPCG